MRARNIFGKAGVIAGREQPPALAGSSARAAQPIGPSVAIWMWSAPVASIAPRDLPGVASATRMSG